MPKPDPTKDETKICDRAFLRYHTDPVFHAKVHMAVMVIRVGWPDGAGKVTSSERSQMIMAASVALLIQDEKLYRGPDGRPL
jgi:hypothetical protein